MSYVGKTIGEVLSEYVNRTTYLPAIQREYVWDATAIEKLFDSLMGDYPISSFLFWKIREENKDQWTAYEFVRDYDEEKPHNKEANLSGIGQDIYLVLDGQQRLTSLNIGLRGSYRHFYYRWKKLVLYLNLLKKEKRSDNPEELTYQFSFRENDESDDSGKPQHWYRVGWILDFVDAEDAKKAVKAELAEFSEEDRDNANTLIGKLHSRIHTYRSINFFEEKSQDYDKVVDVFIRANTGGEKLEYSDILLSTATAKWKGLNARDEIHGFTDELNAIGARYRFGKDFVLKGALYLTDGLPIQYKVKNFTNTNLEKIEKNWDAIKASLTDTVGLVSKFGYSEKNLVAWNALLPIALYLQKLKKKNYVESSAARDVEDQVVIQRWLALVLLKGAFGGASDTTLKDLQDILLAKKQYGQFPQSDFNASLGLEASFNDAEISKLLGTNYATKYSYLILSLFYPDRDWKDMKYNEDHIFPKTEFTQAKLKKRGYSQAKIDAYLQHFNTIANLELLTDSENKSKSSTPFDKWLASRDANFKKRHWIPQQGKYGFDDFLEFIEARRELLVPKLQSVSG